MENNIFIEVWIASHIHSQQRFEWAKEMLKSLSLQTDKNFNVFLSYSQENYIVGDLGQTALDIVNNVNITYHCERKTQFEHIRHIYDSKMYSENNTNTFVLFCDDDDMYVNTRIEKVKATILKYPETYFFRDYSMMVFGSDKIENSIFQSSAAILHAKESDNLIKNKNETFSDFANNIVKKELITLFFTEKLDYEHVNKNPNIQGLLDCAFSSWLMSAYVTDHTKIKEVLYLKRIERSIPSKIMCWDKNKDFDFNTVKDEWKLNHVFFEM